MDSRSVIKGELDQAQAVLASVLSDESLLALVENAASVMIDAINDGKKILTCGNGGSHCDAMHFAEELLGRFRDNRPPLPAICASDPSYLSCVANDYGFEHVFSRFVEGVGTSGDVLLVISTSGKSPNVINAAQAGREKGLTVVALTGNDGGELAQHADIEIRVPHSGYADRIQEVHIKVIHILILLIEKSVLT